VVLSLWVRAATLFVYTQMNSAVSRPSMLFRLKLIYNGI